MIVVKITMSVIPEKQKELLQTLFSMIGIVEKEAGCLGYAAFCDIEDKNLLILLEEWQTRKQLDSHLKSETFGVLLGTRSLLNEPHGIHIYTVNQSEGMEAVDANRRQKATTPEERVNENETPFRGILTPTFSVEGGLIQTAVDPEAWTA